MATEKKERGIPGGVLIGAAAIAAGGSIWWATKAHGAEPPLPPPGKANLSGVVRNSLTNEPVAGALVNLGGVIGANTNISGNFALSSIDPGTYNLVCSRDGYQPFSASVTLTEGNNTADILLVPVSSGSAVFEYASNITFVVTPAGGDLPIKVSVSIKNTGNAAGTATAEATVKTHIGVPPDAYEGNPVTVPMGSHEIGPGQTVIFSGNGSIPHEARPPTGGVSEIIVESEAGTLSSVFGTGVALKSFSIPATIPTESQYEAQVVLQLPYMDGKGVRLQLSLVGKGYGMNFTDIITPAVKADIMPPNTDVYLRSHVYDGARDYTLEGVWYSDYGGAAETQHLATATYQVTQQGTGAAITKALPSGVYEVWLKATWVAVLGPHTFGDSGLLLNQKLGTVTILPGAGWPSGIYNMTGGFRADPGQEVVLAATIRNGSPVTKTFKVSWSTNQDAAVGGLVRSLVMPANSEVKSSYPITIPAEWGDTWGPLRVFCIMQEGATTIALHETYIDIPPNYHGWPPGTAFNCWIDGAEFYTWEEFAMHMYTEHGIAP